MKVRTLACLILSFSILAAIPANAIEIGDKAPRLKVEKWIKGDPVDLDQGQGKHAYIVEFWATWCGPCRVSIPHLTELQKKYKDKGLVVIGIAIDSADGPRPTRDAVEPFVKKMGDKMDYHIALDTKTGETNKAYMDAFGVNGIPHAFLIDKRGRIVWHTHPQDNIEGLIEKILAPDYDDAAAKRLIKERKDYEQRRRQASELAAQYFQLITTEGYDQNEARNIGNKFVEAARDHAGLLNAFAWELLTGEYITNRDLDLAMRVADVALKSCDAKEAAIVDTYARALWENGHHAEAIDWQRKAVKLAEDGPMKESLQKTLTEYEKKASK